MKYIIEIENEPFGRNDDPFFPHGMDELYRAKGFKSLVFDQNGLDKLTPYTVPDREAIENEVWGFVSKLVWSFGDKEILGMGIAHAVRDMTYQEAKAKYEEWKNQKDLRMGDEVILPDKTRGIIMNREDDECIVINKDSYTIVYHVSELRNTGRHYDCIINLAEVLKRYRDAV